MNVWVFVAAVSCSVLMKEANSKTVTYKHNGMSLNIEKSETFSLEKRLRSLKYDVHSTDKGFKIEFAASKDNLNLERLKSGTIRISPAAGNKLPRNNAYLDISVKERAIKSFKIIDTFNLRGSRGTTSLLNIVVEPVGSAKLG